MWACQLHEPRIGWRWAYRSFNLQIKCFYQLRTCLEVRLYVGLLHDLWFKKLHSIGVRIDPQLLSFGWFFFFLRNMETSSSYFQIPSVGVGEK